MWSKRYFAKRYFAQRYFPQSGGLSPVVVGGICNINIGNVSEIRISVNISMG